MASFNGYVVTIPDESASTECFQTSEEAVRYMTECTKKCKFPSGIMIHQATINFGNWSWI